MGFPGEEEVEKEVPAIICGTLESWRLEEVEERWRACDEVTESERPTWDSLTRWYWE